MYVLSFYLSRVSVNLMYYAVTLNSHDLVPGNVYLNNFLLALVEIPASVLGKQLIQGVAMEEGRRVRGAEEVVQRVGK